MQVKGTNLGPVVEAEFTLEPGVNLLRGENGVGKTHIRQAIARALGVTEISVPVRDGATKGLLEIDGVTLLAVSKVNRATNQADVVLASTSPLSTLVEPGIKEHEAAEKARIKALLQLVEVKVNDSTVSTLVGNDEEALTYIDEQMGIDSLARFDVVNVADLVRRKIHEHKRHFNEEEIRLRAEATAANPEKPARYTETSSDVAKNAHEQAVRKHERLSGESTSRKTHERERAQIRETIGTRPDVEAANADFEKIEQLYAEASGVAASLRIQLATAEANETATKAALDESQKQLASANIAADSYDKRQAILDTEITGATDADVEKAKVEMEAADRALEDARASDAYRADLATRDAAEKAAEEAKVLSEHFEDIALNVTARLGIVLADSGLKNLTVNDGELCVIENGKLEAFTRLSFGERTRIGAELLAKRSNPGAVVNLDPEFWAGLSPTNKKEAAEIFAEKGLFVLSEEPADGDLRVEQFQ